MIEPFINRMVLFVPHHNDSMERNDNGVCAAIVVKVHHARLVNLAVLDANGNHHPRTSVVLVQPGEDVPNSHYCYWASYPPGAPASQK